MDISLVNKFKSALEKERELLVNELKSIAVPDPHIKGEWDASYPKFDENESGSRDVEADEVQEYELRLETEHSLESKLLEVTRALERIAHDTYGICARCGKEIPIDRLRANPSAEFHIEHARQ
ncbi:MAG: TraR/DksA family transcriptional regulator [Parcubacteria group bacterium Gr01-1014_33]|nr:MAG: TraR/DksA family transcriptional regulator [Parcubacteria group bacterium Gr01-1014_33]